METMARRLDFAGCSVRESGGWTPRIYPRGLRTTPAFESVPGHSPRSVPRIGPAVPLSRADLPGAAQLLGAGERPIRLLPISQVVPRDAQIPVEEIRVPEPGESPFQGLH